VRIAPVITVLRKMGTAGLDLMLPPSCMGCDSLAATGFTLCAGCFNACQFITAPFCRRCGVPFAYTRQFGPKGTCPGCVQHPPRFGAARAAMVYDTSSRGLVLAFKYEGRTELARLFAPMLARAGAALLAQADLLVPVPLHPSRLRARGYNQAALLAQALARLCTVPAVVDGLQRSRRTPPMSDLGQAEREAMMRGAIRVTPGRAQRLDGARIVLVDDVLTSGATSNACAAALMDAGAIGVDVLAVARVRDPELDQAAS
jgi:ComF family protein